MIKFGIIGCGSISGVHVAALKKITEANLVACCDVDVKKGQLFASNNHCAFFTDYHDLLQTDVDAVIIATPHYLHAEMSIAALSANKHVLCEKPMAISIEQVEQIKAAVQKSNKEYVVCFQNRFNSPFIELKEDIESNKFGNLKGLKCELTWKRDAAYYAAADWKGSYATEGGGVLINQAIHTLDAISWFCGQPYKIKGKIMTALLEGIVEVEESAMATAVLADEIPVVIFATNDYSSDPQPKMTFDFEKATVELTMSELIVDGQVAHETDIEKVAGKKEIWGNGHDRLVRAFVNKIEDLPDPLLKNLAGIDAEKSLQLITAIYRSDATNQWEMIR